VACYEMNTVLKLVIHQQKYRLQITLNETKQEAPIS